MPQATQLVSAWNPSFVLCCLKRLMSKRIGQWLTDDSHFGCGFEYLPLSFPVAGPWRGLWIRRGYDPRQAKTDEDRKAARSYQVIDVKLPNPRCGFRASLV